MKNLLILFSVIILSSCAKHPNEPGFFFRKKQKDHEQLITPDYTIKLTKNSEEAIVKIKDKNGKTEKKEIGLEDYSKIKALIYNAIEGKKRIIEPTEQSIIIYEKNVKHVFPAPDSKDSRIKTIYEILEL